MATTVGETVSSTEMVVAQFDDIAEGTTVESLMIEFDQAKYEEYLSSSSSSGKTLRRRRKEVHLAQPRAAETAMSKSSTRATAEGSAFPKPTEESTNQTVANQPVQPQVEPFKINLGADHVVTIEAEPSLSRRARQRRRQALARREAAASMPFDGLNYYSDPKKVELKRTASRCGGLLRSGEPTYTGGPRSGSKIAKTGELGLSGELHSNSKAPRSGELNKRGEPPKSGGVCSLSHLPRSSGSPEVGEIHYTGGDLYEGEARQVQTSQKTEARQSAKLRPRRRTRLNSSLETPKRLHGDPPQMSECRTHPSNTGGSRLPPTGDLRYVDQPSSRPEGACRSLHQRNKGSTEKSHSSRRKTTPSSSQQCHRTSRSRLRVAEQMGYSSPPDMPTVHSSNIYSATRTRPSSKCTAGRHEGSGSWRALLRPPPRRKRRDRIVTTTSGGHSGCTPSWLILAHKSARRPSVRRDRRPPLGSPRMNV